MQSRTRLHRCDAAALTQSAADRILHRARHGGAVLENVAELGISIQLDGETVVAAAGETVLHVARRAGRAIPTLCHVEGLDTPDSCLLCVVEVAGTLVPSCSLKPLAGMQVATHGPRIKQARQAAMQLLLSEHQGECRAPCELACPVGWDIAEFEQMFPLQPLRAMRQAFDALALPTTLGQVCDAPCHRACRRGELDRYLDIRSTHAQLPLGDLEFAPLPQGPKVLVAGGGPTGLAAAQRLLQLGYQPIVFEREAQLGGSLRRLLSNPASLNADLQALQRLGVQWQTGLAVTGPQLVQWLGAEFAGAIVAVGASELTALRADVRLVIVANAGLHGTPIRRVALGRTAAEQLDRQLRQSERSLAPIRLRYQDLSPHERLQLLRPESTSAQPERHLSPTDEAKLCLACGCAQHSACQLNDVAAQLHVPPARIPGERRPLQRDASHPLVVLESHKCVLCQACVAVSEGELSITGRGFASRPAAAFGLPLGGALSDAAALRAAAVCPTRAFALHPGIERVVNG